jgi:hypothetical protein
MNLAIAKINLGDRTGCEDLKRLEQEGYPDAKVAQERFCKPAAH